MAISFTPNQVVPWDDFNALLTQHGSPQGAKSVQIIPWTKEEIRAFEDRGLDPTNTNEVSPKARYHFEDGSYLDAQLESVGSDPQQPSGSGSTYRVLDYKPSETFKQAQRKSEQPGDEEGSTRGPQTGPTREVRRGGQWVVEPNPVYQRPDDKESVREGDTRGPQTGKTREVFRGGKWTVEPNPVYQEPKPEERAPGVQTVQGGDGQTYTRVVTMGPNNTPVIKQYGPNGQEVAAIPGEKEKPSVRQQQGSDGQTYTIVTTMDANNRPTVQTFGPDGKTVQAVPVKPVAEPDKYTSVRTDPNTGESMGLTRGANPHWEVIPVQGQETKPTTRAPSMPHIVVGASQDALRSAYDDIQAEVDAGRRTPAWGENRRKEVYETAQLTVNEAHLHEQSRQFNQSLSYNVANARMQNQQGVLEFALRSALSINGKIKKGSSAGAELFRGLFNLGMRMQADSGINDIRPGGGQSSIPGAPGARGAPGQTARAGSPTTRPPMDIGDAKALAAHADQEAANIAAGLERNGQPRVSTPGQGGPPQPLPVRNGVPVTSTPAAAAQTAPRSALDEARESTGGGPLISKTSAPATPPPASVTPAPVPTGLSAPAAATRPWTNNETGPSVVDRGLSASASASRPWTNNETGPSVVEPRFAAMESFRMKMPQVDPLAAQAMDPMQGVGEMPAALTHTQIAATPPWLLPQDRLADLVGQYGEDAVFSWPGMPRSEVMA